MREWVGRRGALLILMTVFLAGCGGGGGGAASADPPPPPPPSPTLSLSQTSVAVSAMQGAAAPASANITLSIANAPAAPLQSSVSVSGTELGAVNAMWQSASQGALTIVFVPPGQLGPGNYTEILTLNVCTDSACTHPIAGSPARITITYTVAGGTPTPVSFYFPQPQSSFWLPRAIPRPRAPALPSIFSMSRPRVCIFSSLSPNPVLSQGSPIRSSRIAWAS